MYLYYSEVTMKGLHLGIHKLKLNRKSATWSWLGDTQKYPNLLLFPEFWKCYVLEPQGSLKLGIRRGRQSKQDLRKHLFGPFTFKRQTFQSPGLYPPQGPLHFQSKNRKALGLFGMVLLHWWLFKATVQALVKMAESAPIPSR